MSRSEWIDVRLCAVRAKMPAAFRGAVPDHRDVVAWCERLTHDAPSCLLLLGNVGVGKTHQAWGCWPHLISLGWVGRWTAVTEQQYLDALLPGGDRTDVDAAQTADLLLLDDVGATPLSDWSRSRLFGLLDSRWAQALPTVITSNLTQRGLAERLGERATSRLGQHLTVVTLLGPDRRGAA